MDDWKRRFVNSTNKAAEMDWFYANLDVHGYSIWKLYYEKAEGEGKMMIKTNNTCKGFI